MTVWKEDEYEEDLVRLWLGSRSVVPLLAQDKEEDCVQNAGKVMEEILKAPDGIPRSVRTKANCA